MTLLEIDLCQVNTFNNNGTSGNQIIKIVGFINNTKSMGVLPSPIHLMNKPINNILFVNKVGNTREYTLVLSFEKVM